MSADNRIEDFMTPSDDSDQFYVEPAPRRPRLSSFDKPDQKVVIDYTNYRGVRRERVIVVVRYNPLHFGTTPHHPEPQWLLSAIDVEKNAQRTFAMKDIHSWRPYLPLATPTLPPAT